MTRRHFEVAVMPKKNVKIGTWCTLSWLWPRCSHNGTPSSHAKVRQILTLSDWTKGRKGLNIQLSSRFSTECSLQIFLSVLRWAYHNALEWKAPPNHDHTASSRLFCSYLPLRRILFFLVPSFPHCTPTTDKAFPLFIIFIHFMCSCVLNYDDECMWIW